MARHIGIVAVSPEGAALCYREILRHAGRLMEAGEHPQVTLHNEPLAYYLNAIRADDWHAVGDLLRRSAEILARCGAEFCFTPDNALQHAVHLAEVGSPIPWLTMTELVTRAIEEDKRSVVGIIGTRLVTTGSAYQTALGLQGIQLLTPDSDEAETLDRIIFTELLYGHAKSESRDIVLKIIGRLAERGCEGVILGSSEAPLLVTPENSPLPIYDAAELLADGAVRHSMPGDAGT